MEVLFGIDTYLFLAVNHLPHTEFLNLIARVLSGIGQWGVIWIVLAIFLFFREEVQNRLFFIPFISVGVMSAASEFLLKWIVARPRPYVEMGAIILDTPGNYSFPSTHATIAFAYAYLISYVEPKWRVWVYFLSVCISLSRMYLGVHYAFDVIGGALIGILIGMCGTKIELNKILTKSDIKRPS